MTFTNVEYRRALLHDYPAILRLNSANFIANLAEADRQDGFLSAVFTLEQTAAMAEDLGTTVAIVDGALAGFLCAFRNDFDHGSSVVAKMIESYDRFHFEGKLLSSYNTYAYGPVCIDRAYRRQGLLAWSLQGAEERIGWPVRSRRRADRAQQSTLDARPRRGTRHD